MISFLVSGDLVFIIFWPPYFRARRASRSTARASFKQRESSRRVWFSVQLYFIIVQSSIVCTVSCVPPEQLRKSWKESEELGAGKGSDCKRISYMRAKGFDKIEKTECGRREWRPSTMKKKKPLGILFIGNSHTYKNDMPLMVQRRVWFRGEVYLGDDPYWS